MKTKLIFLFAVSLLGYSNLLAQDCNQNLSLFNDSAKAGIFQDALQRYKTLIEECPEINIILYKRANKMFDDMIDAEEDDAKKKELAEMQIENLNLRLKHFPNESPIGNIYPEIGKLMYEHRLGTTEEQFQYFEDAWNKDPDNFKSPKGLYEYFLLFDKLEDAGKKDINDLFVKYEQVIDQIERMENDQALVAKPLMAKKENEDELSSREERKLKNSGIYLKNYAMIKKAINGVLGQKADCENLIPMYNKDFEDKKFDKDWLTVAASRMNAKDCTSDPLFFKLVESLHDLDPSAKTAFYLGRLAKANGDENKALDFYKDAAELEENALDKAKAYFSIGEVYKKRGAFSSARKYYELALSNKPSMGIAYLRIAAMIASSANDCGGSTFDKRAVYWKAANYAKRAASVDATLRDNASQTAESYEQRAPSNSDIFQEGKEGQTINFGCWFGGSVKVPKL